MSLKETIEEANAAYVLRKEPSRHPAVKCAILTCMDARMDPAQFAGLADDGYVIRNAGGRVTEDAVRSLVISAKLLGTTEWYVIHHTECGMASITNETMRALLKESVGPSVCENGRWRNVSDLPGAETDMNFLPIAEEPRCLIEDVKRLRAHPLVPKTIPIYGYMYDIHTGRLEEIPEASAAGRAQR